MNRYIISPEVAGQLGDNTVLNHQTKPPIVEKLHYAFDDWLGDDIIESFPCFICTERLAMAMKQNNLSGYYIDVCEISKSELFNDLNEDGLDLPVFYWFKVTGTEQDDFSLVPNSRLIVSQEALNTLRQFNIKHCDIKEYNI